MWLRLGNVDTAVTQATPAELRWLDGYLSFEDGSARFSPAVRAGNWDGKIHLLNRRSNTFPTGLVSLVRKGALREGFAVEVADSRSRVDPVDRPTAWLDPVREQPQVVESCLREGRGVVWAPTGSGKTEAFIALGVRIPCPWVVLVHKADLLHQTADRFTLRTGEKAGVVGDGVWEPRRWTVATFQTLHAQRKEKRARELLGAAGGVVTDECHVLPSATFNAVLRMTPNAYWRFGFSGTPLARGDNRNIMLVAATGPVIHKVDAQKLVAAGVLSRPKIRFVEVRQRVAGYNWQAVYAAGVVESQVRNEVVCTIACVAEKPTLLFVKEIAHGQALLKRLRGAGVLAEFVHGVHDTASRGGAIKRLQRGDTEVLITSSIFDAGIDIPEVRSVVIAAGGKSVISALQRLGRGMRVMSDKGEMQLWDIDDQGNRWLAAHSEQRLSTYTAEGFDVSRITPAEVELAHRAARSADAG